MSVERSGLAHSVQEVVADVRTRLAAPLAQARKRKAGV
jgi:hypothetical protein